MCACLAMMVEQHSRRMLALLNVALGKLSNVPSDVEDVAL